MTAWLDRVAADLDHLETDLRRALRALARGQSHPRLDPLRWDQIALQAHEARTLLRAAAPVPIAVSPVRGQHAHMLAALATYGDHMLALNNTWPARHDVPAGQAIAAAAALGRELAEWRRQMEWRRATRAAGVRWPCPRAITPVIGLQAAEHTGNKHAGQLAHPAAPLRLVRQLAADRQLDLALPSPAERVDHRQLYLHLVAAA